jgi:NADH:ubiquinone oxidoreductase subunit 2 (subunit N)
MYMREGKDAPVVEKSGLLRIGLAGTAILTIVLGLYPGPLVRVVEDAAKALVS